jgi:hypothetical protein
MKTLSQLLLLLTAVFVLGGCIDPDQGGQSSKTNSSKAMYKVT